MNTDYYAVPEQLLLNNPAIPIHRIDSDAFLQYGTLLDPAPFSPLVEQADRCTSIPFSGTIYETTHPDLEPYKESLSLNPYFNGAEVQVGYCNGHNVTINGAEYHKSPELFIAVTDCLQFLTSFNFLDKYETLDPEHAELFYFPKGSAALINEKVLHLAPLSVHPGGFKAVIILPKGTNKPIHEPYPSQAEGEERLYFKQNKWILAHPERTQLVSQGVHIGLTGTNRNIHSL